MTLTDLERHPHARAVLGGALREGGSPSHAYLFHGPAGAGKARAARAFAAELLAEGAADPDGVRGRVQRGTHPDLGTENVIFGLANCYLELLALGPAVVRDLGLAQNRDKLELEALRRSVARGQPFGGPSWQERTAKALGLQSTFRRQGRPRKSGDDTG